LTPINREKEEGAARFMTTLRPAGLLRRRLLLSRKRKRKRGGKSGRQLHRFIYHLHDVAIIKEYFYHFSWTGGGGGEGEVSFSDVAGRGEGGRREDTVKIFEGEVKRREEQVGDEKKERERM